MTQARKRVVITGIGAVSPNGIGADAFHEACVAGRSGVSALTPFANVELRTTSVAAVRDFDPLTSMGSVDVRRVPRIVHLAMAASREALTSCGLEIDPANIELQRRVGVSLGTGGGGLAFVEEQYQTFFTRGTGSLFSITAGTHGNLSSELSIDLHLRGPSHVLSTGCASSTDAIGYAAMLIRHGSATAMLAGGSDAPISPGILTAFEKMRVVSTHRFDDPTGASRPFHRERDGFILGEGSWMFILEDLEHAEARGAKILAEIAGYGSTCDAYHRVQIAPEVEEPVRAIELALSDASIAKAQIGYINYHGTATQLNDRMETQAIRKCFGALMNRIPGSSTKSMIGHPQGACGAAGIAATIMSMRSGEYHPTINLNDPDPECDLDYLADGARKLDVEYALCNCIAFGSKNSAMILKRWDS